MVTGLYIADGLNIFYYMIGLQFIYLCYSHLVELPICVLPSLSYLPSKKTMPNTKTKYT